MSRQPDHDPRKDPPNNRNSEIQNNSGEVLESVDSY